MKIFYLPLLIVSLVLTACVTPTKRAPTVDSVSAEIEAKKQRQMVVENHIGMSKRLARVTYPLLVSNAELCGEDVKKVIGAGFWNINTFGEEWRETVQSLYGLTDLLEINYVLQNSPAENAGLQAGDIIVSVNNKSPSSGENATQKFQEVLDDLTQSSEIVTVKVNRDGKDMIIPVTPVEICNFSVTIQEDDTINAYADGSRMIFTTGMMDFARDDQELALVVAHELAHNSEKHIDAKKTNAMIGGLFGLIIDVAAAYGGVNTQGTFTDIGMQSGATAYSIEFERNADYVGLYYMSRAGYEIDGVANFWRRMSLRNTRGISMATTHPSNAERYLGIEKSVQEIKNKIALNQALIPESITEVQETEAYVSTESPDIDEPATEEEQDLSIAQNDVEEKAEADGDPVSNFFKGFLKGGNNKNEDSDSDDY